MGQKLSELRGYMLTMEGEENGSNQLSATDAKITGAENGNVGENRHFENIYGTRNDSDGVADEVNGNDVYVGDCESPCLCSSVAASARASDCRRRDEPIAGPSRRTTRSLPNIAVKKCRPKRSKDVSSGSKKKPNWGLRLNCARLKSDADMPDTGHDGCVCTGYKRAESPLAIRCAGSDGCSCGRHRCASLVPVGPAIDLARFNPEDFPIEDCDERARLERAREMAEGIDPPPGFVPGAPALVSMPEMNIENLDSIAAFFQARLGLQPGVALSALSHIDAFPSFQQRTHSQADYLHCLVPDLLEITRCSYYWGKMDRYEAERLLDGRPEGTFLLRDSAQEEHLFSVSFRKYDRSLHARIEQWNHKFSFDSHDPGVFSSPTVVGLIEHYKDSSFCMFFEPMLTIPLHRTFPFPLQHLCRATICSATTYDHVNRLPLPRSLKSYLREYHYKQRLRIRYLDSEL